jgi:glycosyltransferase involved in cell wall biosynthesis
MRLALVTRRFWPLVGGAEMAMANLAVEFRRQGHQVRVITARWERHWPIEMEHREVPVLRLPQPRVRGWGTLRYMWALAKWLRDHRGELDGVLVSMLKHDAYAALGELQPHGMPIVLRAEGGGVTGDCHWQRTARFGARIHDRCLQADAIVALTEGIREELLASGYSADRIARIDNGVRIPAPRTAARRMMARLALQDANYDLTAEEQTPVVVYTGRLAESKGLFDLIKAWELLVERRPTARLWLVGEGPDRERLFDLVCDLGLKYRICLPGAFDDIEEVLQAADAFVLPSYAEGMSLSLLEAMAAGLPVVATDIPGNRELVASGECGRLVPPRDPQTLARTLEELLDSPAIARQFGDGARERVQQHYSLEKMAGEHLALFERLQGRD